MSEPTPTYKTAQAEIICLKQEVADLRRQLTEARQEAPVAPAGFPGGNAAGYEAIRQQMAQRCANCAGVVNAYGQCLHCDTTEPGLCN